jgi:hypothetical protein
MTQDVSTKNHSLFLWSAGSHTVLRIHASCRERTWFCCNMWLQAEIDLLQAYCLVLHMLHVVLLSPRSCSAVLACVGPAQVLCDLSTQPTCVCSS